MFFFFCFRVKRSSSSNRESSESRSSSRDRSSSRGDRSSSLKSAENGRKRKLTALEELKEVRMGRPRMRLLRDYWFRPWITVRLLAGLLADGREEEGETKQERQLDHRGETASHCGP